MDLMQWCSSQELVFVGGCPRSGTTWMQALLLKHPRCFGPDHEARFTDVYEMIVRDREGLGLRGEALREQLLVAYDENNVPGRMGPHNVIDRDAYAEIMEDVAEQCDELSEQAILLLAASLCEYAIGVPGSEHKVLAEKTPQNVGIGGHLLDVFERSRFIEVVRDGRDVAVSMQFYASAMTTDRREQFETWAWSVDAGEALHRMHPHRCLRVHYHALNQEPHSTLAEVFRFLELEATPEIVDACVAQCRIDKISDRGPGKHVRAGNIGDWREHLSADDLALFEKIAGRQARALGYL